MNPIKVPSAKSVWSNISKGAGYGLVGGASVGILTRIMGDELGSLVGGALASAVTKDDFYVKNASMDAGILAMTKILGGGQTDTSTSSI